MLREEACSRLMFFVSLIANSVNITPASAIPASRSNNTGKPEVAIIVGTRKVNIPAPSFPDPADIPCEVVLMLVGNSSVGMIKVVELGPIFPTRN